MIDLLGSLNCSLFELEFTVYADWICVADEDQDAKLHKCPDSGNIG